MERWELNKKITELEKYVVGNQQNTLNNILMTFASLTEVIKPSVIPTMAKLFITYLMNFDITKDQLKKLLDEYFLLIDVDIIYREHKYDLAIYAEYYKIVPRDVNNLVMEIPRYYFDALRKYFSEFDVVHGFLSQTSRTIYGIHPKTFDIIVQALNAKHVYQVCKDITHCTLLFSEHDYGVHIKTINIDNHINNPIISHTSIDDYKDDSVILMYLHANYVFFIFHMIDEMFKPMVKMRPSITFIVVTVINSYSDTGEFMINTLSGDDMLTVIHPTKMLTVGGTGTVNVTSSFKLLVYSRNPENAKKILNAIESSQ